MITLKFHCGGCEAVADGTRFLHSKFNSLTGRGYGFGVWKHETAEDVCPEGWIAFDPYTQCTYCPTCWDEILHPVPEVFPGTQDALDQLTSVHDDLKTQ